MQIAMLKTYTVLAEKKSFSKTASLLYISQPALTQQIQKMEEELGFSLINRSRRNVFELTPAGKLFYEFAKETVARYENTLEECRITAGLQKAGIIVGIDHLETALLKNSTVVDFAKSHPDVALEINYGILRHLMQDLISGENQMAFVPELSDLPSGYSFHPVVSDTLACVMARSCPLARKKEITFEDLRHYVIRIPEEDSYVVIRQITAFIKKEYPDMKLRSYRNISISGSLNKDEVFITMLHRKVLYKELKCIPLKSDFHVVMGYAVKDNASPAVMDFIRMNQEDAKA